MAERETWKCGRCLLDKDGECSCGWPFSFLDRTGDREATDGR